MLDELHIRGLGVIEEASLPLGPGLTVVTGETGAGKTMVVTSLLLLFGGRADPARVRNGSGQASVEGTVVTRSASVLERVRDAGGEVEGGEVLLRRVVTAAGRSRAHAGGAAVPAAVLADVAEDLFAIHGQSDQLRLVRPGAQRSALDRFGGVDTAELTHAYTRWRAAAAELDERRSRTAELRRESELLAHGVAEIELADPQPGEFAELTRLAARLGHADALRLAATTAHDALVGGDDAGDDVDVTTLLGQAGRALASVRADDDVLDALAGRLAELAGLGADLGAEFGRYADGLDSDPARLAEIEQRRSVLTGLIRKYCDEPEPSLEAVLRWVESARARLASIDVSEETLQRLEQERDQAQSTLITRAVEVSRQRRAAADRLAAAVTAELGGLAMADAELQVAVEPKPATGGVSLDLDGERVGVTTDGIDEVTFLLRPHASAPALPLARGASGGELSRVMLALELCLLGGEDSEATLVFDEVDAGVGGRAAVEVGRRLARLARGRQVLVVTHLAQVAAFADRHVVVDKGGDGQQAVLASDVRLVDGDQRLAELARMLSGSDSPTAREHAAELLTESLGSVG